MSDGQIYVPDYLRSQKDKQLHSIADMLESQIERLQKFQAENASLRAELGKGGE